ncbi:23S rRNA U2552 (ribose-2'-O)-methylase RlmE/FtsJ [Sinorhizobium terangae]|uniref:Class I SAM-dependent methyltransferase n=1 Tax=Sinorhizobium terangae TaxID=110322 RepID=A0A6N7LH06_SINTE|nr:class I SAM-dependent methyltransferase [Sinorhizobium terangae]MBB4189813.1 23S rRNA U2552 (ribose-2'-O)-methylase RlmE/FtsJ [Sinorhizobium terangae]MQX16519.1 hypothetical protein [Sinorhizobium terangae]
MALKSSYNMLSPDMLRKTTWKGSKTPPFENIENTTSGKMWSSIPGGHKWLGYFPVYDREFSRFRGKRPRVLEIGVYRGASLRLWSRFFGVGARIVGVDVDSQCSKSDNPDSNIHVEIGDQRDAAFLRLIVEKYGPFDLIIDDGSHVASHQIASFNALFMTGLKNNGIYFVEDLECMYWSNTDDFRDAPVTSTDFFKMLIDVQNSVFEDYTYQDFQVHRPTVLTEYSVFDIAKSLSNIKFARGVVVIEKMEQEPPRALHL